MKTDPAIIREMWIDDLLDDVTREIREFWERHDEAAETFEDQVPNRVKKKLTVAIIEMSRRDLQSKTLKQISSIIGESRRACAMRADMIADCVERAGDAAMDYFDRMTYAD